MATSILAAVSFGISQMKLKVPFSPCSGMSCHGLTSSPARKICVSKPANDDNPAPPCSASTQAGVVSAAMLLQHFCRRAAALLGRSLLQAERVRRPQLLRTLLLDEDAVLERLCGPLRAL